MAVIFIVMALSGVLHPFHVSVAEAHWNADGTRLQVALRLTPRDLDAALSEVTGRPVVLERQSAAEAEELVQKYVRENLYLSTTAAVARRTGADAAEERRKRFHWMGMEQEVRYTWAYFELERPMSGGEKVPEAAEVWLTNRLMFSVEPTQINTLQLLKTDPPVAVRTNAKEPTQSLPVQVDSKGGIGF